MTGVVDPNPALPTAIHAPPSIYWKEWWDKKNQDTDSARQSDADRMPWQRTPTMTRTDAEFQRQLGIRGLHVSMFDWPLKPEHARAIWEFRANLGPSKVYVPASERANLPSEIARAHDDRATLAKTIGANKKTLASLKKKRSPTAAEQTQMTQLPSAIEADESRLAELDRTIRAYEEDNRVDRWMYEGDKPPTELMDELQNAQTDDYAKRLFHAFRPFVTREGAPNAINTYDLTFTFGTGFNVTTGLGNEMMRAMVNPPAALPDKERIALRCALTYLRKAGVYFAVAGSRLATRVAHVEKRGDTYIGWVLDDEDGQKKHPAIKGKRHNNSVALEAIRYRPRVLDAFVIAGAATALPDQEEASAEIRCALVDLQWQFFLAKYPSSEFRLNGLLKTQSLFTYLIHVRHFGSSYLPDYVITWAIARRLVTATVTYTENGTPMTTTKPLAFRASGVGDAELLIEEPPPPPAPPKKVSGKKAAVPEKKPEPGAPAPPPTPPKPVRTVSQFSLYPPSAEVDIQIGRLTFLYYMQSRGGRSSPWKTWVDLWDQFKKDLTAVDDVKTGLPDFPLRAKADVVAEAKTRIAAARGPTAKEPELQREAEAEVVKEHEIIDIPKEAADIVPGETLSAGPYVGLRKVDRAETPEVRRHWSLLRNVHVVTEKPK
ncbi:hypothetical protein [Pendulispora albinea]|uniref:Uncharacterized protein n=1 Tax=Pendulispora albinea TaxID=2741071 RepID=A0ABZ2LKA2_9BACT